MIRYRPNLVGIAKRGRPGTLSGRLRDFGFRRVFRLIRGATLIHDGRQGVFRFREVLRFVHCPTPTMIDLSL